MSIRRYTHPDEADRIRKTSCNLPSWHLTARQICDLELILNGAFSPLTGFMTEAEVNTVSAESIWRDHFFPVPIVLDVSSNFADHVLLGQDIVLRDREGVHIALLKLSEKFSADRIEVNCGTIVLRDVCLAGEVLGIEPPRHHDFKHIRLSPEELRNRFEKLGWRKVLGFATRWPLHRQQVHEICKSASSTKANLLIAPAVGAVDTGNARHYAIGHCFEHVMNRFPVGSSTLCLLPLVHRRRLGIKDLLLHAMVLRNYGCSHYMVDQDFCPVSESGMDYGLLQETLLLYNKSLGIRLIRNDPMLHCMEPDVFIARHEIDETMEVHELSRLELQKRVEKRLDVPQWVTYPEILAELQKICKPRTEQGFTIFFTGLSGAGKSSIANAVLMRITKMTGRSVSLLDGDSIRQHLSSELGFSKEHRDLNILRIAYVASQVTKHGGIAICTPIAPYRKTREAIRSMIEDVGGFIEVHVATSIRECEKRDRKGLYAKARAGMITGFTGIDDPYEEPERPELKINTEKMTVEEAAQELILILEKLGYIKINMHATKSNLATSASTHVKSEKVS